MIDTSFKLFVQQTRKLIDEELERLIPTQQSSCNLLFDAARYSLLGGGKRLRPLAALAVCQSLGTPISQALRAACTIEMVHAYSLIHDDLPSMDNDDWRRGKPTLHRVYPEGHAILTGDYLLTYAFQLLAEEEKLSPTQRLQLIAALTKAAGSEGMIAGQVMDLFSTGKKLNIEELQAIHHAKTGALFVTSILFGAIVANATAEQKKVLIAYAEALGLAFQIIDDILDVVDSISKHGKKEASDTLNGKTTYATLLGLENAKQEAHNLYGAALSHLDNLDDGDASLLRDLAAYILPNFLLSG